jgi:hypothetical protein
MHKHKIWVRYGPRTRAHTCARPAAAAAASDLGDSAHRTKKVLGFRVFSLDAPHSTKYARILVCGQEIYQAADNIPQNVDVAAAAETVKSLWSSRTHRSVAGCHSWNQRTIYGVCVSCLSILYMVYHVECVCSPRAAPPAAVYQVCWVAGGGTTKQVCARAIRVVSLVLACNAKSPRAAKNYWFQFIVLRMRFALLGVFGMGCWTTPQSSRSIFPLE